MNSRVMAGQRYADFMKGLARKMPEGTGPFVNEEKVKLSIRKGPSAKQKAEANRIKAMAKRKAQRGCRTPSRRKPQKA